MPAKMTLDEIHAFLDSRPGWIALSTISPSGHPHTVPIGYFRLGEKIYMGCRKGTQKTKNIERNPAVAVMLESGTTSQDIKGVCIQGTGRVITDPAEALQLRREAMRRRGVPEDQLPTEVGPDTAYIEVTPTRYISWDYSKQG
ncbi:pyridoxamine 5'-phosphate oxidase family protein [Tepidiforma bonchosmolovskayae]|jgi:nitroimidazol reductase NimA-like FMN-containing flavoprotein (pyridoxamine 5'-phosphate oxidase superfamily)|nr:pyridoxamine 5'-phosphate oxidase family protein [Tepidiforma bonchosmolovskayae]